MFYFDGLLSRIIKYFIGSYIDLDFTLWVTWLLFPLFVTVLLPFIIFTMVYSSAVMLHMYRYRFWYKLRELLTEEFTFWNTARTVIAGMWDAHGWFWHGYEVMNIERIPDKSSALFIYYHGALPIDLYYFLSKVFLMKNRLMYTVADHFLFKVPGLRILGEGLKVIPGTVQQCSQILRENNLMAISPGGLYEAQLGDSFYKLLWRRRTGFAKVAIEAKVPIIPIFTRNVREAFRSVGWCKPVWNFLYSWTRLPIVPIYGGFPVKLVTYVGEPIPYDPSVTPEELAKKVSSALEDMIHCHQKVPGSISRGLLERLPANRRRLFNSFSKHTY